MNVNKRITTAITVVGILTLLLIGAVAVPMILSVSSFRDKIAAADAEINKRYALRRHTRSALTSLKEMQDKIGAFSRIGIVEGKELEFVRALEATAAEAGVEQEIALETVNQRDLSAWTKEIPLKINLEGDFPNLLDYMYRLEALPYYVVLRNIDLSQPRQLELNGSGRVQVALYGTVLWYAEDQPALKPIASAISQEAETETAQE